MEKVYDIVNIFRNYRSKVEKDLHINASHLSHESERCDASLRHLHVKVLLPLKPCGSFGNRPTWHREADDYIWKIH